MGSGGTSLVWILLRVSLVTFTISMCCSSTHSFLIPRGTACALRVAGTGQVQGHWVLAAAAPRAGSDSDFVAEAVAIGPVLVHLGVGRKRGAPAPDLAFRSHQPLFLSFRLSSSALKLPNPEKPAFSFILNSAPRLPASLLTNGSTARPSHLLPPCSREKGPSQATPGSPKKKQRKHHRGADSSPHAPAVKGKDEVSSPPRKKKNLTQEDSVSLTGKKAAGKGPSSGQEGPGCQDLESRPKQQVPEPGTYLDTEPISPLKKKKKKKKRRMEETEERCSGTLSSGR